MLCVLCVCELHTVFNSRGELDSVSSPVRLLLVYLSPASNHQEIPPYIAITNRDKAINLSQTKTCFRV